MQIKLSHLNAAECWDFITHMHRRYNNILKYYGYKYSDFLPKDQRMYDFINTKKPTPAQIQYYHDIFVNEIYKESDLSHFDTLIKNEIIPRFQHDVEKQIVPLLSAWKTKMPEKLSIECLYGNGASYGYGNTPRIIWRMSEYKGDKYKILDSFLHEFVHILIEEQIIQKYNVPQDLKEHIVDLIGSELFNRNIQKKFANPFVDKYITPDAIKTDLESAVKKMMADYNAIKQQQNAPER